ncbi:MAG TPA: hypothetical protein VF752_01520 [Thermoleophilaceae bacterium]
MEPDAGTPPMAAPVAIYLRGTPSPRSKSVSQAFLDLRPGALIVVASD